MNKATNIAVWTSAVIMVIVLMAFSEVKRSDVALSELDVAINTSEGNYFISKGEIEESIYSRGYQLEYNKVKNIDVHALEEFFDKNPSIEKAQVFISSDGKLSIDIEQRKPILRLFTNLGESYYIDENGWLMPLSKSYSSRVMTANGWIDAPYNLNYQLNVADESKLDNQIPGQRQLNLLYNLAKRINKSEFWDAQINQIYLNSDGEIELIPRVGNHRIIVGDGRRIDQKLTKLMAFYKEGLNKTGWNDYKVINLKYKNQVVCTKK